jgi:outer membrane protein assembly factor BamB
MKSTLTKRSLLLLPAVISVLSLIVSCNQQKSKKGSSGELNVATNWSESENIKWKTEIHGKGWSTPVILGDQIWATTATEDGKKMYAICVSAKSGEILHDILVLENEKPSWKSGNNTYATPSPVAKDGFVYAEFGEYGTACIDAKSGKIVWKRTDISTEHVIHGPASSPVLYKNLLILHHEATKILSIIALDIKTGATVWQVNRPEEYYVGVQDDWHKSHASPIIITVNGKDQLISVGSQVCQAFDPETGKEIWRIFYGGHDSTVASPVFWNGIVYINTGLNSAGPELWAVRPDGSGDVTLTHVIWKYKEDVPSFSNPVIKDDLIFMVNEKSQLSCLDAKTGVLVFKQKLSGNYNFTFSPILIGDKIYLTSHDGITTVIKADKTFQLLAENKLDGKYIARPVVLGKSLILRSDTHIYRIEK